MALMTLVFLAIEARRYRHFDIWRTRGRADDRQPAEIARFPIQGGGQDRRENTPEPAPYYRVVGQSESDGGTSRARKNLQANGGESKPKANSRHGHLCIRWFRSRRVISAAQSHQIL